MTGKEVIEELNSVVGKKFSFYINNVIFNGELEVFKDEEEVVYYAVGDVMFAIKRNKKYKEEKIEGLENYIRIYEVK